MWSRRVVAWLQAILNNVGMHKGNLEEQLPTVDRIPAGILVDTRSIFSLGRDGSCVASAALGQ